MRALQKLKRTQAAIAAFTPPKKSKLTRVQVTRLFAKFAGQCRIRSQSKYIPFELYEYQKVLADLVDRYSKLAIYKTRQIGVTEVFGCKMLHDASQNPGFLGAVVSIGQPESSEVSVRVRTMPTAIKGWSWNRNGAKEVQPFKRGRLLFRPSTQDAIRSLPSVTFLFADEVDFIRYWDDLYSGGTAAQEMAGENAKLILVSTPSSKGRLGNLYQIMASDNPKDFNFDKAIEATRAGEIPDYNWIASMPGLLAWEDEAGFCKIFLHWRAHPIYSQVENYLEVTQRKYKITDARLQREYNLGIDAAKYLFDAKALEDCTIARFEHPNEYGRSQYLAGIDPNFGGDNYFVLQIWRIANGLYHLAHEYAVNAGSIDTAIEQAAVILMNYKPYVTTVETNGGGQVVLEQLNKRTRGLNIEGLYTTHDNKIQNTDRLSLFLTFRMLRIPIESRLHSEMPNFDPIARKAIVGYDDAVMAASHALSNQIDFVLPPSNRTPATFG